jgi:hypothetical protein
MSALAHLQRDFRAALLGGDGAPGMAVYRHTYRAQLLACLADTFPVLRGALGRDAFAALSIAYALAHPPHSWSLDHFPAGFAPWLGEQEAPAWQVDLARIEWALATCFVAPDQAVLTLADMAAIDWDQAQLSLIAAACLVPLATNAADIWIAAQEGATTPAPVASPGMLLVWRRDEQCHLRPLTGDEAQSLAGGDQAFAALCDRLCAQWGDEAGVARAGALLAQGAQDGIWRRDKACAVNAPAGRAAAHAPARPTA